jgi:site-specific recombinase XerD
MKTWRDRNGSAIGRFVQQHRLYHPSTLTTYRSVLHGFQDAVERRERSPSRVSRRTLENWLHECSAKWAPQIGSEERSCSLTKKLRKTDPQTGHDP